MSNFFNSTFVFQFVMFFVSSFFVQFCYNSLVENLELKVFGSTRYMRYVDASCLIFFVFLLGTYWRGGF